MIQVHGLTREFQDFSGGVFRALDNVTFNVQPGEIFGLLGPNGAGKTTCLRILSTILKPTRGIAEVAGINVMRDSEAVRRRIGFMSGNTGIYDRMTAREMVEYFGRLYGIREDRLQQRIDEIFDILQMHEIGDRLGSKMSTGMKQKVSIARTIVHDPPVIIFDEPTSGLDVLVARNVLEAVEVLRDQGKCIVYSTHIMSEVDRLCERIAIIHRGRILASGHRRELVNLHCQPNVEELFFDLIREFDSQQSET
ncbi:MAG: ATP-binding cassette domain-containing protein [Fuerstiella sp.]|nr:ATP-binding cassette domain-containing protein [Fuerstiella sp.]